MFPRTCIGIGDLLFECLLNLLKWCRISRRFWAGSAHNVSMLFIPFVLCQSFSVALRPHVDLLHAEGEKCTFTAEPNLGVEIVLQDEFLASLLEFLVEVRRLCDSDITMTSYYAIS